MSKARILLSKAPEKNNEAKRSVQEHRVYPTFLTLKYDQKPQQHRKKGICSIIHPG